MLVKFKCGMTFDNREHSFFRGRGVSPSNLGEDH